MHLLLLRPMLCLHGEDHHVLQMAQAEEEYARVEREKQELAEQLDTYEKESAGRLEFMDQAERQKQHKAVEKDRLLKRLERLAEDAAAAEQSRKEYEEVYQTALAVRVARF